jgi:DHA2 family multidrug resistance protein
MTPAESMSPLRRLALTVLAMIASITQILDTTIANVALPHMQATLGATQDSIAWVLTSYIIAVAIATPLTGWLEDRFGRRALFTACIAGFTVTSALCGAAQTLEMMVAARIAQGLSGALLIPLSQALILDIWPFEKRAYAMSIFIAGTMIGPISGPVLGGILTESFNWRWVFYVNVPFGIVCTLGLWLLLEPGRGVRRRLDVFGFATLSIALAAFQLMLDRGTRQDWFASTEIVIEAFIAAGAFWMFAVHTWTARVPLIPRALFTDRNFAMSMIYLVVVVAAMYSVAALTAPMLQQLLHYNPQQAGILMAPRGFGTMLAMIVCGRFSGKVDERVMMVSGCLMLAWAHWIMTGFDLSMDRWLVMWSNFLQGIGVGLVTIPLNMLAFLTLPPSLRTDGSAAFALVRAVSASAGIAAMGALFAYNSQVSHADLSARITGATMPLMDQRLVDGLGRFGGMIPAMVDGEINRQALMIAYLDDFWVMMWLTLLVIPFTLLLRPVKAKGEREIAPVIAD